MSKKNNRHYRPRHARSEEVAVKADKRSQTTKRSFKEKQLQMGSEAAGDLFSEQIPDIPRKKSAFAPRVNLTSLEEQPKPIRKPAVATPNESSEIAESPEIVESSESTESTDHTANPEIAESPENTENAGITENPEVAESSEVTENPEVAESSENTEDSENTESSQEEESADAAVSAGSDEETANEAQDGVQEPVSDATEPAEIGEEEDALAVSVLPAVETPPEELAELYDEAPDFSQEPEEQPRKKKKWKRVLIAVVSIPLALIIALLGTFFVMREIGRRNIHEGKKFEVTLPSEDESNNEILLGDQYGRIINYNGVPYVYNNDIVVLTFIGVDDGHGPDQGLKMADAIYVLAINTKNGSVKILNISRDIITDVNVYSQEGAFIDTEQIQIAYSNAYSEKGSTGGENTNKSVSRLLYGLPMENYFEINLGAVSTLNDAVGGVTVTSALTFTSPEDGRTINEGDVVTLHGKEAEFYVRRRDITELTSNNDRMQRQQEYIMSFLGSIVPEAKKNPGVISELYTAISENSETSLSASELIYIASSAIENLHSLSDIEIIKFDGEIVAGTNAEMYVTNEEVLSKMLDIFYEPLNSGASEASESTETVDPSVAATQPIASEATTATPTAETAAAQETQAVSATTAG